MRTKDGNGSRLKRDILAGLLSGWAVLCLARASALAATSEVWPADEVAERIRSRLEAGPALQSETVGGDALSSQELRIFYDRRLFRPAWARYGNPSPSAFGLLQALRGAARHGLNPGEYHLREIEAALEPGGGDKKKSSEEVAELDVLLTDAFLAFGSHLLAGRVDPAALFSDWVAAPKKADLAAALDRALAREKVGEELESLAPNHPGYARLQDALARYRDLARRITWEPVPGGEKLVKGDRGGRVRALRARLAAESYLEPGSADPELFDAALDRAARLFQRRNGLAPDGVIGPATLAALNVSAKGRVRQIEANLERWRWLPQKLGARYLRVNIADFSLEAVEGGEPLLAMPVVVGKPLNRTPVFSGTLTHLVVNPSWTVPQSIAEKEIVPLVRRDRNYLSENGFRVFSGRGTDLREINPDEVNWKAVSPKRMPFWFRQGPGPRNALGTIKFILSNRFDVYLHDTPARELFGRSRRDFSHGCIRVGKPMDLATYVLRGSDWTEEEIRAAVEKGEERTVQLPKPIPVHIWYCTTWAEPDGTVQFRNDLYGHDANVAAALDGPPRRVAGVMSARAAESRP